MTSRWKKGVSGNPAGRKPGKSKAAPLREAIAEAVPEIVDTLITAAKGGDIQAARILVERAIPALRPIELPVPMSLSGDSLSEQGRSLLTAAAAGELAPNQLAQMLSGLGSLAKLVEADDHEKRLAAIEAQLAGVKR